MKKIVVYYSFGGNVRLMAENIAIAAKADLLELKPKKEIISKGFTKYLWGGRAAIMKVRPELQTTEKDPGEYDVIFIGTPVWAWTYAPPLNTFFASDYTLENKKIALFCCHGGWKGGVFDKMKKALKSNYVLGEIDFREPLKNNPNANIYRAREWVKDLKY